MHTYTHTLKHTQVCMCTQTNTHWNAIHFCSLIQVGAHASIVCEYASFTAKLLKRPKLCCQSAFWFHHFWRKPSFLRTRDAAIHAYCLLSCRYAHHLISRIRQNTCRWSCPLCFHTPDCRTRALLHTRWCLGGKREKNQTPSVTKENHTLYVYGGNGTQ